MRHPTLGELTAKVVRVSQVYADRCGIRRDDDWYALKLQEECGELIAEHLRLSGRGRSSAQTDGVALADEAADLMAHVLLFCAHNRIDLESALHRKWFRHLDEERPQ